MAPVIALLGFYGLFSIGFLLYSIYAAHHLNEYGYSGDASQQALRAYIFVTSVIFIMSLVGIAVGLFQL